ncbi:MAG: hypothetical protein Pars2KO_01420 [Parasphingorhabdus sp.]
MSHYSATIAKSNMKLSAAEVAKRLSIDTHVSGLSGNAKKDGFPHLTIIVSLYAVLTTILLMAV